MKAISLWQPWASLIACGWKPFETRSWAPPRELIGELIAIHAAKKIDRDAVQFAEDIAYGQHPIGKFELADALAKSFEDTPDDLMAVFGRASYPVGCVVAVARLDAAFQLGEPAQGTAVPAARVVRRFTSRVMPECFSVRYDDFGNYAPGRWAWLLRNPQSLKRCVPAKGARGFFDVVPALFAPSIARGDV